MFVYRCLHCAKLELNDETYNNMNFITVTDSDGYDPDTKCVHCGRGGLVCDHPSAEFDKAKKAFICGQCNEQCGSAGLSRLRQFVKSGNCPELTDLIDVTAH